MKTFEDKRREKLNDNKMLLYSSNIDELEHLFRDKSYALVSHPGNGGFVPLIPRHMTNENWRNLFWMGVTKLVVHSIMFRSLCSACRLRFECLKDGVNSKYSFECKARPESLIIPMSKRRKGESSDEDPESISAE